MPFKRPSSQRRRNSPVQAAPYTAGMLEVVRRGGLMEVLRERFGTAAT